MAKNKNYNFKAKKNPEKRMGEGDYAGLPSRPIYMTFKNDPQYRGGIINSFVTDVEEVSDIYENVRED